MRVVVRVVVRVLAPLRRAPPHVTRAIAAVLALRVLVDGVVCLLLGRTN